MKSKSTRNVFITVFVIIWSLVFHYESIRYFYLNPIFKTQLPQVKFLFPPAGWIMFFKVDDQFAHAQVYGVRNNIPQPINPHAILETRTVGFDNIHRGILGNILGQNMKDSFCGFLDRKFPDFDNFFVTAVFYPSLTKTPDRRIESIVYKCD